MMEFEAPDWRALHSSLARRRRFAFCPVGYYLHHVPGRDGYANQAGEWHYQLYAAKHRMSAEAWVKNFFRSEVKKFFSFSSNFRRGRFDVVVRRNFEFAFGKLESGSFYRDPKIVPAVMELENGLLSADDFYARARFELNNMSSEFLQCVFQDELSKLPQSNFNYGNSSFCWQLGGVNFVCVPDLVWRNGDTLRIMDMNSYAYSQERMRQAELFRVYCWRFMQIAPEKVEVINLDPCRGEWEIVERSDEDFSQVFMQLAGEAAMWRDYLLNQYDAGRSGVWNYAQKDKCSRCRFHGICPAETGTAELENDSINFSSE